MRLARSPRGSCTLPGASLDPSWRARRGRRPTRIRSRTPTARRVELRIVGNRSGGNPNNRRTVEVGAAEWNAKLDAPPPDADELYFLRARFYDPVTGRFIGRDPLQFDQRYAYAGNNPTLLTDPSGLCPVCVVVAVGVATGLTATEVTALGVAAGAATVVCLKANCGEAVADAIGEFIGADGDVLSSSSRRRREQAAAHYAGILPQYLNHLERYNPCHPYADSFFDKQIVPFHNRLVREAERAGIDPPDAPGKRKCGDASHLAVPVPTPDPDFTPDRPPKGE